MKMVRLGKTGLQVSYMGFGGIPIQRTTPQETKELFMSLLAQGVNYVDTARAYTVSEEWIGRAIEGMRDRFVLATKSKNTTAPGMAADIEISLKNLRTGYIDLYQVHNPSEKDLDTITAPGGALEALLQAKEGGKIGHIGLTAHSLKVFERALELPWVETIMFPYNLVETQGEALIHRCREKDIGFIAMKPLAGGALGAAPGGSGEMDDSALALRFIAQNPDVTMVIPGVYCAGEVEKNAAALQDPRPLREEEQQRIEAVRDRLGNHFCRRCNYCAPCTKGISIPNVFLFEGYLTRYGLEQWARERYASLPVKAGACIQCGACEPRCPYQLPIRQMMRAAAEKFGE